MSKIAIIGSGFSGLSAAAYLAAAGHQVEIFVKNSSPGGRARQLRTEEGYVFDMGPSWYWMPEIMENFFNDFGKPVADFFELNLLDPAFEIVFDKGENLSVPSDFQKLCALFESKEKGSAAKLRAFMSQAEYKYRAGMSKMVHKPGLSLMELADADLIRNAFRLQVFSSFSSHVRAHFSDPRLIALMEFPVLFLGGMPQEMPAMYSLMNYAGLKLGTWYPQGGFGSLVEAMLSVAEERGARLRLDTPVTKIITEEARVTGLRTDSGEFAFDTVVAAADYHHVEKDLLPDRFRNYGEAYWERRTFAPSCLIFYLGINRKLPDLGHHTLFFEEDLFQHSLEIYKDPQWPSKPLFYACCPSKTDRGVAPEGHENLFLLMPLAPGLEDTEALREQYFRIMIARLEKKTGTGIEASIAFKKSYCVRDFIADYNSYKGNAYGLANTLRQTANLRPRIQNRKLKNLFYTGQLTVPGPGVPPSLISGKVVAGQVLKQLEKKNEVVI